MGEHRRLIDIASDSLGAQIDPLGAQLHTMRDSGGRDLLWDGDPAVWTGRAPVLFPIVGMLVGGRYRLGGKTYHLGKHGFARRKLFEVVSQESASATFRLRADAETLHSYPFPFELELRFALEGAKLEIQATIRNLGAAPMPASFGFHPAFCWPLPFGQARSEHAIQFAETEPAPIRRLDSDGLLKIEREPTPVVGKVLLLHDRLFEADAVIFDQIRSRALSYGAPDGPSLTIAFPGAPYLGVWTKPGADFIAIEPWHGINDRKGFDGDIWDKPGIFVLKTAEERKLQISILIST